MLCLLGSFIFCSTVLAATPYQLKITVQNPLSSQFTFSYGGMIPVPGNTCTSEGPNEVLCTIYGATGNTFTWTNQKTPSCSIKIEIWPLPGSANGYKFYKGGTGNGNNNSAGYIYSFPSKWDGTSNLSTELVISGVAPGAQCAN
jgi:hypothetical protein